MSSGVEEKRAMEANDANLKESSSMDPVQEQNFGPNGGVEVEQIKRKWYSCFLEPGHAAQIIVAAILAIAIGLGVTAAVGQDMFKKGGKAVAAPAILGIPGTLWLRALQAVVIPLIVTSMILAVQSLREITTGGRKLAQWTVGYYVLTTILAIAYSIVMTSQIWAPLMVVADEDTLDTSNLTDDQRTTAPLQPHEVAVEMFNTLVTKNIVASFNNNELLAIIIASIVIGYLMKVGDSSLLRAVKEVHEIISKVIVFLIKLAPYGVFFLILPNMFKLDLAEVGTNLGYLIGGSVSSMMIHLWIILPLIFFAFTRKNPWTYWFKCSKAWITAWGTASSAATLPMTLRCCRERGNPNIVVDFAVPLGCLINMDGTSIYFPVVVVFMAQTQGITLNAGDYILVLLLSSLSAIGTAPIPSSSLVLTVMICSAVGIPLSGMYAVVVAIDWFIDRFRTMVNVSGDLYACAIISKMTGLTDDMVPTHETELAEHQVQQVRTNEDRV